MAQRTGSTAPGRARPALNGEGGALDVSVLLVDDEPELTAALARILRVGGAETHEVHDVESALDALARRDFDVIVSDVKMPHRSGIDLLRRVREKDLDLPVLLLTGEPTYETAASAVELGAFRYLRKPVESDVLVRALRGAVSMRRLALTKGGTVSANARAELEASLRAAIASLRVVYQPIVDSQSRRAAGWEALMRSDVVALPSPPAVLDAAQKLGALHDVGRRVRELVANDLAADTEARTVFVNLHPADLADRELYEREAPLSRFASRVVLELTERATLETVAELDERLARLRALGYRMAVDDLGAGYAGLSYFARVTPEIVKIDMSLVRGVDRDPVRQQIVASLVALSANLGMTVVAEGVETTAERDCVVAIGCTYVQGYALARPGPTFPGFQWT